MSGPAVHKTLVYYCGDTIMIDVTCVDRAGRPIQLVDVDLLWLLDDPDGNNVVQATSEPGGGIQIADANAGKIQITVDKTVTSNFVPGFYQDQLKLTTLQGNRSTQLVGLLEFKPSLSNVSPQRLDIGEPTLIPIPAVFPLGAPVLEVQAPDVTLPDLTEN